MSKQMPAFIYNQSSYKGATGGKAFIDMTTEEKIAYYEKECEEARTKGKYKMIGE